MDFLGKLETSTTRAAITLLPVHNIRFEVVTPDRAANSRLLVYAMYFELHTGGANMPLPVIGTAMRPADVMTWRVPFANSTYQQGNINFAHDVEKGIRVKIVWPFYQNRTMIAHFDSTMNVRIYRPHRKSFHTNKRTLRLSGTRGDRSRSLAKELHTRGWRRGQLTTSNSVTWIS